MTEMRQIFLARIGSKTRPVLLLTRDLAVGHLSHVTIAPVTSTVRGIAVEVHVGPRNGLDHDSVVNVDNIQTIPRDSLGRPVGELLSHQEAALTTAVHAAFDLD